MICELLGLPPSGDMDLPSVHAPDSVLVGWLAKRLGRRPSWFEVLELRWLLRARVRRQTRWAWWRRRRPLRLPRERDLIEEFLSSIEGQMLFRAIDGGITALAALLRLPDPFEGYDGRHPTMPRPTRLERLRKRVAYGGGVPLRAQAEAVTIYARWKVNGLPVLPPGDLPEMVEFLSPAHAAAINVMSPMAATDFISRLRTARCMEAGRRTILQELCLIGTQAAARWPELARVSNAPPLGWWPETHPGPLDAVTAVAPSGHPDVQPSGGLPS